MENRIIIENLERTFCNKCYKKIEDIIFKEKKDDKKRDGTGNKL